jgi:hypothetical protein
MPQQTAQHMEYSVQVLSKAFLSTEEDQANWSNATVSRGLWEELIREHTGHHRLFLSFHNEEHPILCAIGNPSLEHTDIHQVYLPYQVLDRLQCSGSGEEKQVSIFTEEAFPEATQITIRIIDSAAYNSDIKEELEQTLGKLGVLQANTQYQIPIQALGNFPVDIFVSHLEPADIVFCQGDEVAIEFEEPVDQISPPPERPPTPIPAEPEGLMLPPNEPPSQGRLLGSDPTNLGPAWRQQIGPPRRR